MYPRTPKHQREAARFEVSFSDARDDLLNELRLLLADDTFRCLKKSLVWDDPKKKAKVEKLLAQLNALMQDDNPIA